MISFSECWEKKFNLRHICRLIEGWILYRAFNRDRTYNSVIMVNRTRRTDHYLQKEMFSLKCIRRILSQISRVIKNRRRMKSGLPISKYVLLTKKAECMIASQRISPRRQVIPKFSMGNRTPKSEVVLKQRKMISKTKY